jgi:hypothetical protein
MRISSLLTRTALTAGLALAAFAMTSDNAVAQSSCQADFQKVMQPRMNLIQRINGFRNKRPTAGQACSTLGQLVAADARAIKWMTDNKEWCQIPDETVEQLKGAAGQSSRARGQACSAAKNQQVQIARMRAAQARAAQQQGGGPPAVGSGVRLPQGAL